MLIHESFLRNGVSIPIINDIIRKVTFVINVTYCLLCSVQIKKMTLVIYRNVRLVCHSMPQKKQHTNLKCTEYFLKIVRKNNVVPNLQAALISVCTSC